MFNSQISAIQYNGDSGKVLRASSDGYKKLLKGLVEKKMTKNAMESYLADNNLPFQHLTTKITSVQGNNVTTSEKTDKNSFVVGFDADNNEVYDRYDIFNYDNEGNLINSSFLWDEDEDKNIDYGINYNLKTNMVTKVDKDRKIVEEFNMLND